MRFLVFSKMNTPIPPDLAMPLFDAMDRFVDSTLKSGKAEQFFSLAGYIGGGAILLISSDLPELAALADRAVIMRNGRLIGELSGDSMTERSLLLAMNGNLEGEPAR